MQHFITAISIVLLAATLATGQYGVQSTNEHHKTIQPCLQWTGGSFNWPCASTKALYKSSNKYISKNVIATRAQIGRDDVFLALPRYKKGVPATLVKTNLNQGGCYTTLTPFPCWSMQEEGNCQALQSVVDIFLDNNEILWALDTGIVDTLDKPVRKCPPKVVAFNTKTGKVLKVVHLDALTIPSSRLQYLVVDYMPDNDRCFVYISDASSRSIIVYDVRASRGFRVVLPKAITTGCDTRDVLYLTLVKRPCGTAHVVFTYLGSKRMFSIRAEYLRKGYTQGRISDMGLKPNKIVIIGTDNGPSIFFRNEGYSEVYKWDTTTPFQRDNFKVVYRSQSCQLATHALTDYKRGTMKVLESNFPDFMQDTVGCGALQQLTTMQGC